MDKDAFRASLNNWSEEEQSTVSYNDVIKNDQAIDRSIIDTALIKWGRGKNPGGSPLTVQPIVDYGRALRESNSFAKKADQVNKAVRDELGVDTANTLVFDPYTFMKYFLDGDSKGQDMAPMAGLFHAAVEIADGRTNGVSRVMYVSPTNTLNLIIVPLDEMTKKNV